MERTLCVGYTQRTRQKKLYRQCTRFMERRKTILRPAGLMLFLSPSWRTETRKHLHDQKYRRDCKPKDCVDWLCTEKAWKGNMSLLDILVRCIKIADFWFQTKAAMALLAASFSGLHPLQSQRFLKDAWRNEIADCYCIRLLWSDPEFTFSPNFFRTCLSLPKLRHTEPRKIILKFQASIMVYFCFMVRAHTVKVLVFSFIHLTARLRDMGMEGWKYHPKQKQKKRFATHWGEFAVACPSWLHYLPVSRLLCGLQLAGGLWLWKVPSSKTHCLMTWSKFCRVRVHVVSLVNENVESG